MLIEKQSDRSRAQKDIANRSWLTSSPNDGDHSLLGRIRVCTDILHYSSTARPIALVVTLGSVTNPVDTPSCTGTKLSEQGRSL
jgi:hypothetical protein